MAVKFLRFAIVFAVMAYLLYEEIPDGYSTTSSIQLRMVQAGGNFMRFLSSTLEKLGVQPWYETSRTLCRLGKFMVSQPTDDVVRWYDTELDGVPVRVYEPRERVGVLPGFVYFHGGGWVLCDVDSHHPLTHQLALKTNTVLISVNYRLAPEHPFPTPLDDCVTATKAFIRNAEKFQIDPARIAIGGDSAGGNLAVASALRLRDQGLTPPVKVQVLIYPVLQIADFMLPSNVQNENGIVISLKELRNMAPLYLTGTSNYADEIIGNAHVPLEIRRIYSEEYLNLEWLPTRFTKDFTRRDPQEPSKELWNEIMTTFTNPYFNPLLAPNVTELPATYIYTGEHDILRDDGFLFAHRLREVGNTLKHFHHDIGFHAIFQFGLNWPETQVAFTNMVQFIRDNL